MVLEMLENIESLIVQLGAENVQDSDQQPAGYIKYIGSDSFQAGGY